MLLRMTPEKRKRVGKLFGAHGMILRTWDADDIEQKIIIESEQDTDPIIANNKRLYNEGDGYGTGRGWKRAASVPNIIIEMWMRQGINAYKDEDQPKILAMLDSPEYLYLRTAPGRLSRRPVRTFLRASTPSGTKRIQAKGPLVLSTS